MTPIESWLSDATRGLSVESAARVRAEIQQHYEAASDAGTDAIAALGDPRVANRAYRKVLLTEQEALMAPVLTQPRRPCLLNIILTSSLLAALIWWLAGKQHGPGFWPIMCAIFCLIPLDWVFPVTTIKQNCISIYIRGLRNILVVAVAWWYQGWIQPLVLGVICFSFDYFFYYRRALIFRKLAAGQTCSLLPEEPTLTHFQAIWLRTLHNGSPYENVSIAVLFTMLAGMAVWQPATFGPMAAWMVVGFLARRTLPVYTEERSRWFRIAKWTTMAAAAILPALYGARAPWIGAAYLAFFFVLFDMKSISLRRKLPAARWPKRLYW
jgi:hypothetical protein